MASNPKKISARRLGERGEAAAAQWYRHAGYQLIEQNWRCFEGEIDLILRRASTTVFCEVKTRASDRFMDPALAVTPAKQAKVRTAAFRWLQTNQDRTGIRFDVALVVAGRVRVIEGAF